MLDEQDPWVIARQKIDAALFEFATNVGDGEGLLNEWVVPLHVTYPDGEDDAYYMIASREHAPRHHLGGLLNEGLALIGDDDD